MLRLRECLVTLGAGVLLLPNVSFNMCSQVSSLGKCLFTLRVGVGLLSCMDSAVFVRAIGLGEGLVTGGSSGESSGPKTQRKLGHTVGRDRVFPCVDSNVSSQIV